MNIYAKTKQAHKSGMRPKKIIGEDAVEQAEDEIGREETALWNQALVTHCGKTTILRKK